jgi:DnaK suppressor protein
VVYSCITWRPYLDANLIPTEEKNMDAATVKAGREIEKLEQQKAETERELARLQLELRSLAEPTADEADVDAYEREKTYALVQRMRQKLESLDRAMLSARQGTYGICEDCGDRIDPARLEILPETRLCLKCQRNLELRNRRANR